jgi:hypothetical protein
VPRLRRANRAAAPERDSVDPRVHHVQGKTERVSDLPTILQQFHREKREMLRRHESHARRIGQYDANNTYQYVINREEVQLSWLEAVLASLGGAPAPDPIPSQSASPNRPPDAAGSRSAPEDPAVALLREDARESRAFVDRWQPTVEAMTNARHRIMLRVILGETLEQERFFEQAASGRTDLLGRRAEDLGPARGEVMATRWVE